MLQLQCKVCTNGRVSRCRCAWCVGGGGSSSSSSSAGVQCALSSSSPSAGVQCLAAQLSAGGGVCLEQLGPECWCAVLDSSAGVQCALQLNSSGMPGWPVFYMVLI